MGESKFTDFQLHPQLERDCHIMGDFPLCRLLLLDDARYPWFVLVPRCHDVREIYQLEWEQQLQLLKESSMLGQFLMETFEGNKLNIGALGNLVPQLHIHHIVRYHDDEAWPGPVWGVGKAVPYTAEDVVEIRSKCASLDIVQGSNLDAG